MKKIQNEKSFMKLGRVTIMKEWALDDVYTLYIPLTSYAKYHSHACYYFSILIMMCQLYFWLLSKFVDFLEKLFIRQEKFLFFPLFFHFEVTWSRYNALFTTLVPLKALPHPLLSFCFLVVSLFLKENKNAKTSYGKLKVCMNSLKE